MHGSNFTNIWTSKFWLNA